MLSSILINEAIKTLKKKRTYISFALLFFLVPMIVLAIGNGSGYLEMQIYGQLKDSFIVFGSLTNGYLSSYLIIAILVICFFLLLTAPHTPYSRSSHFTTSLAGPCFAYVGSSCRSSSLSWRQHIAT